MEIPDHLTCLLRNLYAGQEATVRIGHGTTDWFQIRKGVLQGQICLLLQVFLDFLLVFLDLYAGQEATVRTGHGTTDWF